MKIKIFDYAQRLNLFTPEENKLESIINDWLVNHPAIIVKDVRLGSAMLPTADTQKSNFESFNTLTQVLLIYEDAF